MFEEARPDARVVAYERVEHAKPAYGTRAEPLELISPLQMRSFAYLNVDRFAHLRVHVPRGTTSALIEQVESPAQPSKLRNYLNSREMVAASTLIMGTLLGRAVGLHRALRYLWRRRKSLDRGALRGARFEAARHRQVERERRRETAKAVRERFSPFRK